MTALTDDELVAAWQDAERRGVGWVRILRLTMSAKGDFRVSRIDPSLVVLLDDPTVYLDEIRALVLAVTCPLCSAQVDEPCVTASGRRTTFHAARSRPIYQGWRLGRRDGLIDAFRRLTDDWDTPPDELLRKHGARW